MSSILAGRFDTFEKAQAASKKIQNVGISESDTSVFYVTPQGQHDHTPIGGDAISDRGAKRAHKGAWKGVGVGAVGGTLVGLGIFYAFHAPWLVILIGLGVGAYIGSLTGAMSHTRKSVSEKDVNTAAAESVRHAGVLLAVHVADKQASQVKALLNSSGAMDIERAEGLWEEGKWSDFDATKPPVFI